MMQDNHRKKHRSIGIVSILSGIFLIIFSFAINMLDNKHFLASGMFQFLEFVSGCLLLYSGFIFSAFASLSRKEIVTRIGLSILSTVFSLIVLELMLQLILPRAKFDTRLPFFPHVNRQIRVDLPGVSPVIHYSTNSLGLRGDAAPDNWDEFYTIITIGGSTTHSNFIDDSLTWSALLQDNLGQTLDSIWVGNAGIDGHSTRGHIIVMEEAIRELNPDMVIFLVGINDLGLSLSDTPPLYGTYADNQVAPIVFKSQLFRFTWQIGHLIAGNVVTTQTAHQAFEPVAINPDELADLPDDLQDLLPQLDIYRDNLHRLIDISEELNLDILFLTQPLLFDDTVYWQSIEGKSVWLQNQTMPVSAATYWNLLDIYNESLLEVCEERDVPCYDLASHIPHSPNYFYDIVHFNEAGSAQVADEITPIVENLLIN